MAGSFYSNNSDSMDISELASLNEDISDDLLEQLQNQLSANANTFSASNTAPNENDDTTLFEEPSEAQPSQTEPEQNDNQTVAETPEVSNEPEIDIPDIQQVTEEKKEEVTVNQNFDDNFIKKYKAKLNKKAQASYGGEAAASADSSVEEPSQEQEPIEELTKGNISERPLTQELKDYNDSLDFLDGNVKYSKYVIYIDPQNVNFIDGLTVKERKNLINNILRQQDDIAMTKQRFKLIQTVIRHVIIAVLTISIAIPLVYSAINASLEATIDNHRRSQTNWQTLYKEHGKITQN